MHGNEGTGNVAEFGRGESFQPRPRQLDSLQLADKMLRHVVVAEDDVVDATVVLSVYEPDEEHGWDPGTGFRSRKEGGR